MEACLGNPVTVFAEHRVGCRTSVTANYVVGATAAGQRRQRRQLIEQLAIDRINVAGAMVTQQSIDRRSLLAILAPLLVGHSALCFLT
jgi:hypothetical protein